MTQVRAKKHGERWAAQVQFGSYWFTLKRVERVRLFGSPEAAREAARKYADVHPLTRPR